MQRDSRRHFKFLHADILQFGDFALIGNFLGYPALLTVLEHVQDICKKEIFFLGTAGVIGRWLERPRALNVVSLRGSGLLRHFAPAGRLALKPFPGAGLKKANGVSVDLLQRETRAWVRREMKQKAAVVEMELFPLRVFLGKPFYALVVATDQVTGDGIRLFADEGAVRSEFRRGLAMILERIRRAKGRSA